MIRWYDWAVALLAADAITSFLISGFIATTWWEPILYGLCAGGVWRLWDDTYIPFRKRQEENR
mgnify:FL=1|jgi:hypothetical protein